jgi:hypothetical protein
MLREESQIAEQFLVLRAKASRGAAWSEEDRALVDSHLNGGGVLSVLAACCVIVSGRPKGCQRALTILRSEIEKRQPDPYVELLLYEALIYLEFSTLEPFKDKLTFFIEDSLKLRRVNLVNTTCLIGYLAKHGDSRAATLLRSLSIDSDPEVRDNASALLRSLSN